MLFLLKSKWLTFWTIEYTAIWLLATYFKINFITKFMNPFYLLIIIAYGFLTIVLYQLIVNKIHYEVIFLILEILLHFVPLLLFQKYFKENINSLLFTIVVIIVYLITINYKNMSIYDIYFAPKRITTFKDFKRHMKSEYQLKI